MDKRDAAALRRVAETVEGVDGWLPVEQGALLYRLARQCTGRGAIVEIGSWKGKSTIWLAEGSRAGRGVPVHAIDPHTGSPEHQRKLGEVWTFAEFSANLERAGVRDLVRPIVATSEAAAESFAEPVELVFIDGAHDYDAVRLDFELWFPKVIDGGVMVFHDTVGRSGPRRVVEERVFRSPFFRKVSFVGSMTVAQKVARNRPLDRLRSRYVLALKDGYERVRGAYVGLVGRPVPTPVRGAVSRLLSTLH